MIDNLRVLGLIPARGGSKGLPRKNVLPLCGKPLIGWSLDAAHDSKYIDLTIVSTDDEEIAAVSRGLGAEVPFLRPHVLASDTATSFSVIQHALEYYREKSIYFDVIVLIEPTSPLREGVDIDRALETMLENNARSIVSVCRAESYHPHYSLARTEERLLKPYLGKPLSALRRQDLDPVYFPEGTVYASFTQDLLETKTFYQSSLAAYEVPKWKSPEIDDLVDFMQVEAIMKSRGIGS